MLRMFAKKCFNHRLLNFMFAKVVNSFVLFVFLQPCNSYLCFFIVMLPFANARDNSLSITCHIFGFAGIQASEIELAIR